MSGRPHNPDRNTSRPTDPAYMGDGERVSVTVRDARVAHLAAELSRLELVHDKMAVSFADFMALARGNTPAVLPLATLVGEIINHMRDIEFEMEELSKPSWRSFVQRDGWASDRDVERNWADEYAVAATEVDDNLSRQAEEEDDAENEAESTQNDGVYEENEAIFQVDQDGLAEGDQGPARAPLFGEVQESNGQVIINGQLLANVHVEVTESDDFGTDGEVVANRDDWNSLF